MGFSSFLGRVLFASLFILSAWQMFNEFDASGGPIAKELIPKLTVVRRNLSSKLGVAIPDINVRPVIASIIFLKGVGGILFVFGSTFGSYLLLFYLALSTPILYDFYNYRPNNPEYNLLLNDFIQSTALFGALLFFIGLKYSIPRKQFRKKTPKAKTV
ncbi:HR lesion-inducer [Spatholobus suberectus]|nr:HR lesion-inducer [Spatholobus suberectus]